MRAHARTPAEASSDRFTRRCRRRRAAADALADELTKKLREAGLPSQRSSGRVALTPETLVIAGKFLTLDEGNQTLRTLVGFGAGASQVRTRVQAWMDGQLVAEAETDAKSGKKPGAAVTLGAGAALGTAATAAAVAAATTGVSELLLTSVQADARRTGGEIADRILCSYRERAGWRIEHRPSLGDLARTGLRRPPGSIERTRKDGASRVDART